MGQQTQGHFLRLFPLESVVLFPGMQLPLVVFEPRYKQLTQECLENNEPFGVLLLRSGREVGDAESEPYSVGTTAQIERAEELGDGRLRIMAVGKDRFRVLSFIRERPYLAAQVAYLPADRGDETPPALLGQVKELCAQYARAVTSMQGGYLREVPVPDSPEDISYLAALLLQGQRETQQRLLEMDSTAQRLALESEALPPAVAEASAEVKRRWSERLHPN